MHSYNIDDLAEQGDLIDSCYALLHGELPTRVQKEEFQTELTRHTMVHEQLIQFYKGFRHDAHPMAIMVGVTGALSAFYANAADVRYEPVLKVMPHCEQQMHSAKAILTVALLLQ